VAKNRKEAPRTPVVSKIPVPVSDSALVIDLPDGQKLVVGKMTHGTVIEVATWRGTGRPDSRTNRMMLGMTNVELENAIAQEFKADSSIEENSLTDLAKNPRLIVKLIIQKAISGFKWLFDFKDQFGANNQKQANGSTEINESSVKKKFSSLVSKIRSAVSKKKSSTAQKTQKTSNVEDDIPSEVDKWLSQITGSKPQKLLDHDEKMALSSQALTLSAQAPTIKSPQKVRTRSTSKTKKAVKKKSSTQARKKDLNSRRAR